MTIIDSERSSAVSAALEQDRVESHLNPPASYDLDAYPVPTGREEVWRFTPLKRLRGILDGEASDARLTWETTLPEGVTLTEISAEEAKELGELREELWTARAGQDTGASVDDRPLCLVD